MIRTEDVRADNIAEAVRFNLVDRQGVLETAGWIDENNIDFGKVVGELDEVINRFNTTSKDDFDPHFVNARRLKKSIGQNPLTSLFKVFNEGKACLRGGVVLRKMNRMMQRGETSKQEPYLAFHIADISDGAKVVGGLLHFYDELLVSDKNFMGIERELVLHSLIEVASLLKDENRIFGIVADSDKLNWVNGWDGFSPEFRNLHAFS